MGQDTFFRPRRRSVFDRLLDVFSGSPDPSLSDEQNKDIRRQSLIQAGLSMLGSDSGSSTLQALAQGALTGQQSGGQGRQKAQAAAQQQQVAQLAQNTPRERWPELVQWLVGQGRVQEANALIQMANSPGFRPQQVERQVVGGSLLERQPDGTWKAVYEQPTQPRAPIPGSPEDLAAFEARERIRAKYRPARPAAGSGDQQPKLTAGQKTALVDNEVQVKVIDDALRLLEERPKGVGWQHAIFPEMASQRFDPKGVELRAAIADVGSLKIKDRSGAVVPLHEMARIRPFIPRDSDTPDAARKKLERIRRLIQEENEAIRRVSGFKTTTEVYEPRYKENPYR